jgi:hypothetical protein
MRTAAAVRARCGLVRAWVAEGRSPHFSLDESRLDAVAAYVAEVTRADYPDLRIPYHSRWRHFSAGGVDRWGALAALIGGNSIEQARAAVDVATVSVLLDAGAGDVWRYYRHGIGPTLARSEGLAAASIDMFSAGHFSSDAEEPWRADRIALENLDAGTLADCFQVTAQNPLIGLEQRATLLRRLGKALGERPDLFGTHPARPGHLVDYFTRTADNRRVSAASVLTTLLDGLSSIWPSGLTTDGFPLGDAGRHPAVRTSDATERIVPFHKLSQWLAYSLIEPLEMAGLTVEKLDELSGLPEYRNGGLFVDLGVIRPHASIDPRRPHEVSSELVVEWRALTVTLLDRLVAPVREKLGLGVGFTIPHLLQGGTWSAGRKIARELRPPDGPSPIPVAADGTVF